MSVENNLIQPINRDTVHRICSGQVVVNLAIAIKELIENAIDANATKIDVRLKEYGSELIEVSDNGTGVSKENFHSLTLKHYTSKLREFSDLESVSTLGFRGEALSSLCALSDLSLITKHVTSEYATKIIYDHNGKIISETPTAREQGTTVSLNNLFSPLPVRRKEFTKNMKREFNKMCQLLYAYCLVSKNIKFTCTNQIKSSKSTVVATEGLSTIRENIICVYGPKQIASLIDIELVRPEETILKEYSIELVPGEDIPFTFECFVSSVVHGSGRSTTDRQFYYINSRPCEPTKVIRLVNEIYKQFNSHQYPFVYLNITTKKSQIDVNVTPDKRQIFLQNEKLLLATIKASLLEAFKTFPSVMKTQNIGIFKQKSNDNVTKESRGLKRSVTENNNKKSLLGSFQKRSKTESTFSKNDLKCEGLLSKSTEKIVDNENCEDDEKIESLFLKSAETNEKCKIKNLKGEVKLRYSEEMKEIKDDNDIEVVEFDCAPAKSDLKFEKYNLDIDSAPVKKTIDETNKNSDTSVNAHDSIVNVKTIEEATTNVEEENIIFEIESPISKNKTNKSSSDEKLFNKKIITLNVSIDNIKQSLKNKKKNDETLETKIRFRSKIEPENNKIAEEELQKQISKDMFKKMEILGQFNLGFIITKLKNDLFIVDQHASDEKYNFEQLQLTTTLENQILVNPKPLELTVANESILMENEEIFKKNGFTFKFNPEGDPQKRVLLTSIPLSKNCIFGKDDIDEMLFMLQDSSNTMCRPSRISSMLASRACRKSVMIGSALSQTDIRRVVDHMGEIEHPWNCPHGRPTIRHLINLDLIQKD